jgi:hypothetical protein
MAALTLPTADCACALSKEDPPCHFFWPTSSLRDCQPCLHAQPLHRTFLSKSPVPVKESTFKTDSSPRKAFRTKPGRPDHGVINLGDCRQPMAIPGRSRGWVSQCMKLTHELTQLHSACITCWSPTRWLPVEDVSGVLVLMKQSREASVSIVLLSGGLDLTDVIR